MAYCQWQSFKENDERASLIDITVFYILNQYELVISPYFALIGYIGSTGVYINKLFTK
jgi:hypothetical protein